MTAQRHLTLCIELIDDPNWMGGIMYLRNLALSLSMLPAQMRPGLRLRGPETVARQVIDASPHPEAFRAPPRGFISRVLSRVRGGRLPGEPVDVLYPGFGPPIPGASTIRWIPDFQHRHLPQNFSAAEIADRDAAISAIAASPGVVVLSSEAALADFRAFWPGHRVTPKVWRFRSIIDTRATPAADVPARFGLPERFLYLPNQFWAHKNHITVFRAMARLRAAGLEIPLVCTGAQSDRRNVGHFDSLMTFVHENGLEDQIRFLGLIDRQDQIEVFRRATAVVQPSLFEGWSTVVEDTRMIGRPIFLSDLPVHREQDETGRAVFFSPLDDEGLAVLLAERWDGLQPGPDGASEAAARAEGDLLIRQSGLDFLSIAQAARDLASSDGQGAKGRR